MGHHVGKQRDRILRGLCKPECREYPDERLVNSITFRKREDCKPEFGKSSQNKSQTQQLCTTATKNEALKNEAPLFLGKGIYRLTWQVPVFLYVQKAWKEWHYLFWLPWAVYSSSTKGHLAERRQPTARRSPELFWITGSTKVKEWSDGQMESSWILLPAQTSDSTHLIDITW